MCVVRPASTLPMFPHVALSVPRRSIDIWDGEVRDGALCSRKLTAAERHVGGGSHRCAQLEHRAIVLPADADDWWRQLHELAYAFHVVRSEEHTSVLQSLRHLV